MRASWNGAATHGNALPIRTFPIGRVVAVGAAVLALVGSVVWDDAREKEWLYGERNQRDRRTTAVVVEPA